MGAKKVYGKVVFPEVKKDEKSGLIKSIELIQPNKVTNARYDFTERQENILTLMVDALQKHMTRELPIQTDLFGEPMVVIDMKELSDTNKYAYLEAAKDMRFKSFEFEYVNPSNKKEEVYGVLVTTVRNIPECAQIEITINKWAIPYLLYWGKGVGGTIFNKALALTIPGVYAKRLYKICKRWEDKGGFSMPIDEFRQMIGIIGKYKTTTELKKVLDRSKKTLKEKADVYFTYRLEKVKSRSYNYIHYTIKPNNKNRPDNKKTDIYLLVYNMLSIAYPVTNSNAARVICDTVSANPEALEKLYKRLMRLKDDLYTKRKTREDVIRLIKYIMKNDYGFN